MSTLWRIESRLGAAEELHSSWPSVESDPDSRAVAVCSVTVPSVVLGSTQSETVVDRERLAARHLSVARRRTGGGAVLVADGDPIWVDLWLPADDVLVAADVGRSFDWLGDAWVSALAAAGIRGLTRHGDAPLTDRWSSLVCFGGIGRGEVVDEEGRKVVGLAQRRSRVGSWFQCACLVRWDPEPLLDSLALSIAERGRACVELESTAVGISELDGGSDVGAVLEGLIDSLPGAARSD